MTWWRWLVTVLIGRVSSRLLGLAAAALVLLDAPVLADASSVPALLALVAAALGGAVLAGRTRVPAG